jgi:hypothetical protein
LAVFLFFPPQGLFAQQGTSNPKFALVIGNGAYAEPNSLRNPVNDAYDTALALRDLGFVVNVVLNSSLDEMQDALTRFKNNLSTSKNSYGFFFYAGHGAQSDGKNYLIPMNAQITSEDDLPAHAVSVQAILDDLDDLKNSLNVVVLDACRANPFGWGGKQWLAPVSRQPENSIIVYAAGEGETVVDVEGRNSMFTQQLLKGLKTPGLEVKELFDRVSVNVSRESRRRQIPVVYHTLSGKAYLGTIPDELRNAARLWTVGASVGTSFTAPWLVGTVHGTIAPWRFSFFEIGLDAGLVSGVTDVGYWSLYPFVHYAFFLPFATVDKQDAKGGWYIGAGGGYMVAELDYRVEKVPVTGFGVDVVTGFNLWNMLDISYTLRLDFATLTAVNKLSAGYTYRFK